MEYTKIDLSNVCRTCRNEAPEMKSLYYRDSENSKENPRVDEMLTACTSVQVDTKDNLSKLICQSCFVQLKNAYTFKEQCEKTDVFMRNYLQTMKSIKVEDELVDVEFTASEVFCDSKPLRLDNESPNNDAADEIIDNHEVQAKERVENKDMDYVQIIDNNVTLFKCRMCPKDFYTLEGLRSHKKLHAGKTVKCRYCDKSFVYLNHLQQHESSHTKPKLHIWKIGNKTDGKDENPNRVENHVSTHKGMKVNVCDVGNKSSFGDNNMEVHKRVHGSKDPVLPTLENLINNVQEHNTKITATDDKTNWFSDTEGFHVMVNVVNNAIIYKCIVCSKEFDALEGLKSHRRLHTEKEYKCKQCNRIYVRLNHFQRHQLSHRKRKMFVCKICNKILTRYEHLKGHVITHLKTRPYSCLSCNRRFNRVELLEKHVATCKGTDMDICHICNKSLLGKDSTQIHKCEHQNNDPVLPSLENLHNIKEHYMEVEVDDEANPFSANEEFNVVEKNMAVRMDGSGNNDQGRLVEIVGIPGRESARNVAEVSEDRGKIAFGLNAPATVTLSTPGARMGANAFTSDPLYISQKDLLKLKHQEATTCETTESR